MTQYLSDLAGKLSNEYIYAYMLPVWTLDGNDFSLSYFWILFPSDDGLLGIDDRHGWRGKIMVLAGKDWVSIVRPVCLFSHVNAYQIKQYMSVHNICPAEHTETEHARRNPTQYLSIFYGQYAGWGPRSLGGSESRKPEGFERFSFVFILFR
jgi:hypothetical protein